MICFTYKPNENGVQNDQEIIISSENVTPTWHFFENAFKWSYVFRENCNFWINLEPVLLTSVVYFENLKNFDLERL